MINSLKENIVTDMPVEDFKKVGYELIDWISKYRSEIEKYPVLSQVNYGDIIKQLPASPPLNSESFEEIIKDFEKIIMPGITHWNHPSFHAYFSNTSSMPAVLGELLIAALNAQGMIWKTSPSVTELEIVITDWFKEMLGLDKKFFGLKR